MFDKAKRILGITPDLGKPMPHYRVVADGLTITDTTATAWVSIAPASIQLAAPAELDRQLQAVIALAQKVLRDRRCHLKVVWGRLDGGPYLDEAPAFTAPHAMEWAAERAESITSWGLGQRHVFLGVDIEDREDARVVGAINKAVDWVRGDVKTVPARELEWLDAQMRALAGRLAGQAWGARPVPVETLAWMISRESYRAGASAPVEGTITGAPLARLMRGRAVPHRDHLRFYSDAPDPVAFNAQLVISQFPDQALDTNDAGQWLLLLSRIARTALDGGAVVDVHAEASVRFEFMSSARARKVVKRTKESAAEQRREAGRSVAGEPAADVQYTEAEMMELEAQITRGATQLVEFWPTLSVSASTLDELDASVDAVIEAYSQIGITVERATDEQAEVWMSALPGDRVRLESLNHISDASAFFGAWFWGGSVVGDEEGPVVGYTTGATPLLVRHHPTQAPLNGDTATVAVLGRSGRGKTTLLQLLALDAAAEDAWVTILDLKGDLNNERGGIVGAAQEMGMRARRIDMSARYSGTCDLLATMDAEDALIHAHSQIMLLVSDALRVAAHPVLMEHIAHLIEAGGPRSAHALIERMRASSSETAQRVARELAAYSGDSVGRMIVGRRTEAVLDATAGINLLQFPKLDLPPAGTPAPEWTVMQRVSAALVRGALSWIASGMKDPALRGMRKLVVVPEAHLFTATGEGAAFLDQTARLGRALGASLALDSQDPTSIAARDGIMEQIQTVYAFSQKTRAQQDAVAEILGVEAGPMIRAALADINTLPSGGVWHGHCLMRDGRDRVATVQVSIPSARIAEALDTNPRKGTTNA